MLHYLRGEIMKIAEVSEHYDISSDTLRYYERIGLIPPVNRNGSGIRDYGEIDKHWICWTTKLKYMKTLF